VRGSDEPKTPVNSRFGIFQADCMARRRKRRKGKEFDFILDKRSMHKTEDVMKRFGWHS
jgi:uncharacterized membrane protein